MIHISHLTVYQLFHNPKFIFQLKTFKFIQILTKSTIKIVHNEMHIHFCLTKKKLILNFISQIDFWIIHQCIGKTNTQKSVVRPKKTCDGLFHPAEKKCSWNLIFFHFFFESFEMKKKSWYENYERQIFAAALNGWEIIEIKKWIYERIWLHFCV